MKEVKINGNKVKYFDSIDEMRISRKAKLDKFILLSSIMSNGDINTLASKFNEIRFLVENNRKDDAITELNNMLLALYGVTQEVDYTSLAFASMVHSINDKVYGDTESDIEKINNIIKTEKKNIINSLLEAVKKKIDSQMTYYFSDIKPSGNVMASYEIIKERLLLKQDMLLRGSDNSEKIIKLDLELNDINRPSDVRKIEKELVRDYAERLLILKKETGKDFDKETVFNYYAALQKIKQDNKTRERLNKKK